MKIVEVMTREVHTCNTKDPIVKAAQQMEQYNVGPIPVLDDQGRLCGLITDRDIVIRGVAKGKDLTKTTCEELMSNELTCCGPDTDIHKAADIMADHQIRRLPVVDEQKRLIGICAIGDLAVRNIYINESGQALSEISKAPATLQ
jgi:CBS domain-containing protein